MTNSRHLLLRSLLLTATAMTAAAAAAPASAQDGPDDAERPALAEDSSGIISRDDLNPATPAPGGALDISGKTIGQATGVNGVGQMLVRGNPATNGLSLCTGTLINPRVVIFAAHCVNNRPASAYGPNGTANGPNPNGTPIAFGFAADNLAGARQWLGLSATSNALDPTFANRTNENRAIYSVEEVWYDPRSLAKGFLEADIALATLDTPAFAIPTWTLLFSPLTAPTHSLNIGYGTNGTSASAQGPCPGIPASSTCGTIDYRRRSVENMLDVLGSLNDRNLFLFGTNGRDPQSLYQLDFDSPAGSSQYSPAAGRYDFNLFGGGALPREGITAGGDSGGPLVVDQLFSKPVVAGVLSGGSRFFVPQRFSTYGTSSFYQPLFLFWDVIVANNSYVYAATKAGDGAWEDSSRWVQLMDPNYAVIRNGQLVNDLPDTPALGVSGNTPKFGSICFLGNCIDNALDSEATPVPVGSGQGLVIANGPGSSGFVPNNVRANPKAGIKARYYDVTLSNTGATTLSSAVTIDRLTLDGPVKLAIAASGDLSVLGETTQWRGWTDVNGRLASGGDLLFATGLLTGSGTIKAPAVTIGAVNVAPGGGDRVGTLTLLGDTIFSSQSALFIDAYRGAADKLVVGGELAINTGASIVFNKVTDRPAPRFGETYKIVDASGGIDGRFATAYTFQGVLRPELSYSTDGKTILAELRAKSLVEILDGGSPIEIAFAQALDQLRAGSYNQLWNLYGQIDWMNGAQLGMTLNALVPQIAGESRLVVERNSRQLLDTVGSRLSLLGTGTASGITFQGMAPPMINAQGAAASTRLGLAPAGQTIALPQTRLSGFVTAGGSNVRSSYGDQRLEAAGQRSWHMASGLEAPLGKAVVGTAFGFAESRGQAGSDRSQVRTSQAAGYVALPLGSGAYVGGLVAAETARIENDRLGTDAVSMLSLTGATRSFRLAASAEAGIRRPLGGGLAVTPRIRLGADRLRLGEFSERGGETALRMDGLTLHRLEGRIGARLDGSAMLGGWMLTPAVEADYVRRLGPGADVMTVRFALAPDAAIRLPLGGEGAGWAEVKGGVTLDKGPLTLGVSGALVGAGAALPDQRAAAELKLRF